MGFIVAKYCVFHFSWSRSIDGEVVKGMIGVGFFVKSFMLGVSSDVILRELWFLRVGVGCLCLMCSLLLF